MSITLNGTPLPDDLLWRDEFAWSAIAQRTEVSLGGALVIEESAQLAGRPITLEGGDNHGWATRAQVLALRTLAENVNQVMTLLLHDARSFQVRFRRPPFDARQVIDYSNPVSADVYTLKINLIEVGS